MSNFSSKHIRNISKIKLANKLSIQPLFNETNKGLNIITLLAGETTIATKQKNEVVTWYIEKGSGRIWRQLGNTEKVEGLYPKKIILLEKGMVYQVKNTSNIPLTIISNGFLSEQIDLREGKGYWDRYKNTDAYQKERLKKIEAARILKEEKRNEERNQKLSAILEEVLERKLSNTEKENLLGFIKHFHSTASEEEKKKLGQLLLKSKFKPF